MQHYNGVQKARQIGIKSLRVLLLTDSTNLVQGVSSTSTKHKEKRCPSKDLNLEVEDTEFTEI